MLFEDIINFSDNNRFSGWTNYNKTNYLDYYSSEIIKDSKCEKVFTFKLSSKTDCYFHIKELEWDSGHFGFKCAQLKHLYINNDLSIKEFKELITKVKRDLFLYLKSNNYKFLFSDINSCLSKHNQFIQSIGFKFIVNWLDGFYNSDKNKSKLPEDYGLIKPEEVEFIAKISQKYYYKGGRFYSDNNFDNKLVDEMYYSIIINSFQNKDIILTARYENKPIGAFICKPVYTYKTFNSLKVAHLRFLVLDKNFRGKNIGYNLFAAMLTYLNPLADIIVTGIETHNLLSLNLHNKFNFKFNYSHNAYHLWI